jgi:uncharacterized repeat protein (TIGR01451 family)
MGLRTLTWKLLLAGACCLLSGCFGVTQNPSYFPYLLPTEDIIQTHAKPIGPGYYANFDPHAVLLEVRPLESTDSVRTQHVLIATVYDEKGVPRRDRRVEWMLEGAGNIIEVDESGVFPGRGYKVDNKYAVSYTSYKEHRITRGNQNPSDDFVIRPGQTWCVISSAVEGDSHVTVYAPEIYNWDRHKVFVVQHWVDTEWTLPPPAVNRVGTEHVISTSLFRHTDRAPQSGYRVRYRVLSGPPAGFLPSRAPEILVASDLNGTAAASLVQLAPQPGVNRIGIEIIRPPDPLAPAGPGIIIGRGETTKEWRGGQVALELAGPPTAALGQEIPYTITITHGGQVESQAMTVRDPLPDGVQLVRAQPQPSLEGSQLIWTLAVLPPGATHTIQVVLRGTRPGPINHCVTLATADGFQDQKCVTTVVAAPQQPQLDVSLSEPLGVVVGAPFTFQVTVTNRGTGPATNVLLSASFDSSLLHQTRANPVELPIGTLTAGESRTIPLALTATKIGRFETRVVATADGGLRAQASQTVTVQAARLTLSITGPAARYVDQPVTWALHVANAGDVPLANVVVRDQLPPEVSFLNATDLGQFLTGQVVWNLGNLPAHGDKTVQVTARCLMLAPRVVNSAVVSADPGMQEQAEGVLEIRGLPAYSLDVTKVGDPVVVGGRITYKVTVLNTGSLPGNQVEVTATMPKELRVLNMDGPSRPRLEGNRVIFPAVDGLQPRQSFIYTIEAQALQPGDVRFHVELKDATQRDPVIKEQSTNIVPALNGTPR